MILLFFFYFFEISISFALTSMDYNIEDEDKETNEEEESDSSEYYSDEIPVWIRGDKRWISGVTDETTCYNLVYVLLVDEGIINDKFDGMFSCF